jgi:hypothetical protein
MKSADGRKNAVPNPRVYAILETRGILASYDLIFRDTAEAIRSNRFRGKTSFRNSTIAVWRFYIKSRRQAANKAISIS